MKNLNLNLNLVLCSSLGLLLMGCPSDDTDDDGADTLTTTTTTTGMDTSTTDEPPDDTTGDPPATTEDGDDTTTDDPPGDTTDGGDTTGDPSESSGEAGLSFATDVYPIISDSCSCHVGQSAGMLAMPDAPTAYGNLVDMPAVQAPLDLIEPGAPDESYLWAKVNGTQDDVGGSGQAMPLMQMELSAADLGVIEQWIVDGALP